MNEKQVKRAMDALARGLPPSEAWLGGLGPAAINTYHALTPRKIRELGMRGRFTGGVFSANLLKLAAALGRADAIMALRSLGGNPFLADDFGRGPIHVACNGDVVCALVAPGPSGLADEGLRVIQGPALDGGTPLLSAAAITSTDEAFRATAVAALLEFGANPLVCNKGGSIPLHFCATSDAAVRLIKAGGAKVSVNARNNYGDCPLHLAVSHGFVGVVQVLLRYGADTSVPSRIGRTIGGGRGSGLMLPMEVAAYFRSGPVGDRAMGLRLRHAVCDYLLGLW